MDELKNDLFKLNNEIKELEIKIQTEKQLAEDNIQPLKSELAKIKTDKRNFAIKNDSDSVQSCIRKENNLKFKINAQWNRYSMLEDELSKLKKQRKHLESQIQLKKDKIKKDSLILEKMDRVLKNYEKSQNLTQSAIDSNVYPEQAEQWFEWGKNSYNETSIYFHTKITEIDNRFRELKAQELKGKMDDVIEAYKKTNSLKEASRLANVSYDTVMYWYEWGSKGFGEENSYFFTMLNR